MGCGGYRLRLWAQGFMGCGDKRVWASARGFVGLRGRVSGRGFRVGVQELARDASSSSSSLLWLQDLGGL